MTDLYIRREPSVAKFRVSKCTAIPDNREYVLVGDTVDGHVKPGMEVGITLNPSTDMTAPIKAVTKNTFADIDGAIALIVQCEDDIELDIFCCMNVENEFVQIYESYPESILTRVMQRIRNSLRELRR